ncbi:helix-turn-helix domain-containing protein [Brochothrix thermosphacta]
MYRNNLKRILIDKKTSVKQLSENTGISRQTISNIRDNEFHDISSNVLTILLTYFQINYYEFGEIYTHEEYLQYKLSKVGFNDENLKKLNALFIKHCNLDLRFSFDTYGNDRSLNFNSSRHFRKIACNGNVRINTTLYGLTFDIIDIDCQWRPSDKDEFEYFHNIYMGIIYALEKYAQQLGFTYIVFNVANYLDKVTQLYLHPMQLNKMDLKVFISRESFDIRDNETLKRSIILKRGYIQYISTKSTQEVKNIRDSIINNYSNCSKRISAFEKENIRILNAKKIGFKDEELYTKYFKLLNKELIPIDRIYIESGF